MEVPTEITFHQLDHSDSLEASVQRWVTRLEELHPRLIKCHVAIELPNKRHRHGDRFSVSVVVEAPGFELASNHSSHTDAYVAVADAFRAARRQLMAHVGAQRVGKQKLTSGTLAKILKSA